MLKSLARLFSKKLKRHYSVYSNCTDLPMSRFIEITVTGNLTNLLISGTCDELDKVWEQIYSEYAEASNNTSATHGLQIAIDISYLTYRLNNIYSIVNYLRDRKVPALIDELRLMGFNYKFIDLQGDLNRVLTRCKSDDMRLNVALEKYNKAKTTEKATRLEWQQRLSQLAKYQGVPYINPALISVLGFVALEKQFSQYIEMQKSNGR